MTTLITLLISLLGYGSPSDYDNYTEDQLTQEIENTQNSLEATDGGVSDSWEDPMLPTNP